MKTLIWSFLLLSLVSAANVHAVLTDWPQEIPGDQGTVFVYQPQVESFKDNRLEARAAIAIKQSASSELVFGAIWINARVSTDKEQRIVVLRKISITDIRFTDASEDEMDELSTIIESHITKSQLSLSLDQLLADLDPKNGEINGVGFKSDPPKIIHVTEPTVLVTIDGKPVFREIENSSLSYVVNSPFLIVKRQQRYYLFGGSDAWYISSDVLGPWSVSSNVPREVRDTARDIKDKDSGSDSDLQTQTPPQIVVSTEPAELIVSVGAPTWSPVEGMDLLYLDNSDSDVFIELNSQYYYTLLSGRWFRSTTFEENSDWEHVPNDRLPAAFSDIPENSPNGHVLSQVSGTPQARDAVLENTIPQTAAIRRDDDSFEVKYDGEPVFKEVEKVQAYYAVNTATAVFRVDGHYYANDLGVWYESDTATGPWRVATTIPVELYNLPPSNPHYNVRYVRIYDVTPDVVYVGYTPGYYGSYYYHGAIVYGTGWYYDPWYYSVYYPHPLTWGFHVRYRPWYGWGFGVYRGFGPITFGFGFWKPYGYYPHSSYPHYRGHHRGWFGVGGYHAYQRPPLVDGYRKSTSSISSAQAAGGVKRTELTHANIRHNIYNRAKNKKRVFRTSSVKTSKISRKAARLKNSVFTDRAGGVYKRSKEGVWQRRVKGKWQPARNLDRNARTAIGKKSWSQVRSGQVKSRVSKSKAVVAEAGKKKFTGRGAARPLAGKQGIEYKRQTVQRKNSIARSSQKRVVKKSGQAGQRAEKAVGKSARARPAPVPRKARPGARRPQLERDYRSRNKGAQRTQRFKQSQGRRPARRRR